MDPIFLARTVHVRHKRKSGRIMGRPVHTYNKLGILKKVRSRPVCLVMVITAGLTSGMRQERNHFLRDM